MFQCFLLPPFIRKALTFPSSITSLQLRKMIENFQESKNQNSQRTGYLRKVDKAKRSQPVRTKPAFFQHLKKQSTFISTGPIPISRTSKKSQKPLDWLRQNKRKIRPVKKVFRLNPYIRDEQGRKTVSIGQLGTRMAHGQNEQFDPCQMNDTHCPMPSV